MTKIHNFSFPENNNWKSVQQEQKGTNVFKNDEATSVPVKSFDLLKPAFEQTANVEGKMQVLVKSILSNKGPVDPNELGTSCCCCCCLCCCCCK